jgi:hypothetical protein
MQKSAQIKSKKETKTNHQGLSKKKKRLVILYIKKIDVMSSINKI